MEQFTMSPLKWDYKKTGGVPRPQRQAVIEHMMQLGEQMSTGNRWRYGERFRGGQYTLVSLLFAPRCPMCQTICKSGSGFGPTIWDTWFFWEGG